MGAGELHGAEDISDPGAAEDERRPPVDHAVPDFSCLVIASVFRREH